MAFSFGNFNLNLTKLNEFAMPFSMKKIKQGQTNDILLEQPQLNLINLV